MNRPALRTKLALAAAVALLALTAASASAQAAGASAAQRTALGRYQAEQADLADAMRRDRLARQFAVESAKSIKLREGDLLAATPKKSAALRVTLKGSKARIKPVPLRETFVPRGVAIDNGSGVVAIAAVSRVVLYDTGSGDVQVLTGPEEAPFAFVNDVLFDRDGLLIVADEGESVGTQLPADGRVWEYDRSTGEYRQIGTKRQLSNPKLLALDERGRIHVVDGNSGPRVTPLLDVYYDTVWQIAGATRKRVKRVYRDAGLQATAFAIDDQGTLWFGSLEEIVLLEGKALTRPCPLPAPLSFVTGVAIDGEGRLLVMDGADLDGRQRTVYEVDASCVATARVVGRRIDEARGLAVYLPSGD